MDVYVDIHDIQNVSDFIKKSEWISTWISIWISIDIHMRCWISIENLNSGYHGYPDGYHGYPDGYPKCQTPRCTTHTQTFRSTTIRGLTHLNNPAGISIDYNATPVKMKPITSEIETGTLTILR